MSRFLMYCRKHYPTCETVNVRLRQGSLDMHHMGHGVLGTTPLITQVGTLVECGGCLYSVRRDTPHAPPPLLAKLLFWHQKALEDPQPQIQSKYLLCYLLKGRGGQNL